MEDQKYTLMLSSPFLLFSNHFSGSAFLRQTGRLESCRKSFERGLEGFEMVLEILAGVQATVKLLG